VLGRRQLQPGLTKSVSFEKNKAKLKQKVFILKKICIFEKPFFPAATNWAAAEWRGFMFLRLIKQFPKETEPKNTVHHDCL